MDPILDTAHTIPADRLADHCRRLEENLGRIQRELDHSQRLASLGLVLGIIAHEFNNILTPILSYSQMALDNPTDAALTLKALQKAARGSEKAARIASSVLALARKDGYVGDENQQAAQSDVLHCATEALHCLALGDGTDGIQVVVSIPPRCLVAINPVALQQVLINLVLNARKALRARRGRIEIRAMGASNNPRSPRNTDSTGAITIEVEDSGRGIDPGVLSHVFEPFVSDGHDGGDGTPTKPGTGLGLAICKRLIEAAHGTITATSIPGKGSCFRFSLPAAEAAQDREAA